MPPYPVTTPMMVCLAAIVAIIIASVTVNVRRINRANADEQRYFAASAIITDAEAAIYMLFLQSPLRERSKAAYEHWRLNYLKSVAQLHSERDWALYTSRGQLPLATHPAYPASQEALREIEDTLRTCGLTNKPIPAALAA